MAKFPTTQLCCFEHPWDFKVLSSVSLNRTCGYMRNIKAPNGPRRNDNTLP